MTKAYTAEDFRHALAGRENGGVATDWEHDDIVDAALRIAARVATPGVIENSLVYECGYPTDIAAGPVAAVIRKDLLGGRTT